MYLCISELQVKVITSEIERAFKSVTDEVLNVKCDQFRTNSKFVIEMKSLNLSPHIPMFTA